MLASERLYILSYNLCWFLADSFLFLADSCLFLLISCWFLLILAYSYWFLADFLLISSYMNGGFFVGQGVFCLDVKFFTPRIFFRSRIRNFTSRIFSSLTWPSVTSRIFHQLFFLPQGTPRIFFPLTLTPRNPKDFASKCFYVKDFLKIDENGFQILRKHLVSMKQTTTVYNKFLALKKWKSCKGAKITPFHHKFLLLMF